MSKIEFGRDLPYNQYQAAIGANNPSASNVFATIADLSGGGTGDANRLVFDVKINETGGINKGQAVYVNGASGTNILVGKADYSIEATSSKTLGLLITSGANNDLRQVVAEGILKGTGSEPLDTSAAVAGDPVWLGDDGNLIYGLINKPYAPNHLVFIGVVVEANNVVGEIFVKVQNGFELDELHDVDLISNPPTDGQVLTFDSVTGLWRNEDQVGSYGRFGIADSDGLYTYYTTLTLAMTAAVAGQTIEFFTDYTEAGAVTITLKNGVNINMNGHTYTSTYTTGAITLFTAAAIQMLFHNGNIIINSGSVSTIGLSTSSASANIDCTGLYIKVISSGGTGVCFSGRGGIKNLRGLSIADDCARIFRGSASNCILEATEGIGVVLGLTTPLVGTGGFLSNSTANSILAYNNSSIIDCTTNIASILGSTMRGGSTGVMFVDAEYSLGNSNECYISNVTSGAVTLRAFGASLFMRGCTVFTAVDCVTITDDSNDNFYISNNTLHTTDSTKKCITKAAGVNLVVYANYTNNTLLGASTPIATTVVQNTINTQDNQGNILSE